MHTYLNRTDLGKAHIEMQATQGRVAQVSVIRPHTVSRSVSCAASPCPALRPPASQCAPGLTDTIKMSCDPDSNTGD